VANRPSIHFAGGCVGPRAGLDGCGVDKIHLLSPGLDTRTIQPVASRCNDSHRTVV